MKMIHHTQIILVGLAAAVLPIAALAQAEVIQLKPGLYDYTEATVVAGFPPIAEEFQYCITEGENSWNLIQLFSRNDLDGNCSLTNVEMGASASSGNVTCRVEELNLEVTSKVEAVHTKTSYAAKMITQLESMPSATTEITATRSGDCPAGWVNPEPSDEEE